MNNGDTNASTNISSLKQMLIDNHTEIPNKGKIKSQLHLEHFLVSVKHLKWLPKNLGFHLTFKTIDPQHIIFTTIATHNNVTFKRFFCLSL